MGRVVLLACVALGCSNQGPVDGGPRADQGKTDGGTTVGCASPVGSCLRADQTTCTEIGDLPVAQVAIVQADCRRAGDAWSAAGCARAGLVGGCRSRTTSLCAITWTYAKAGDAQKVQSTCAASGGTFLAP